MARSRADAHDWRARFAGGGLAAGLLLCSALAETSGQEQAGKPAGYAAGQPAPAFPTVAEAPSTAFIDADPCPEAKSNHQEDRCISWHAAKAAEDQARWAKWTFFVGCAGTAFVLLTLFYTRRSADSAQASARAAERAVKESAKTLAHAREIADRQLRPWLTIAATLDSRIEATHRPYGIVFEQQPDIEFFARLCCTNVGNTGARNVVYRIATADLEESTDPGDWFRGVVESAVHASIHNRPTMPYEWRERDNFGDSLAPSEKYVSRRWCPVRCTTPPKRPHWSGYQFNVCVVVAYTGVSVEKPTRENVFYTAKMFPIGFPEVPVFQKFIGPDKLPIGPGDVALGPARLAEAT